MPIPSAVIAALAGSSFLAGLAKDLVSDLIKDVIGNAQRGAIDYLKFKSFENIFRQWTAEFYQSLIAEPHVISGLSSKGLIDLTVKGLETAAKMSIIFNPEVVEELFLEIIQEGFSNAIQFSIGGAFQNILSFWRGSYGVQTGQSYQAIQIIDNIDDLTLAWLLLSSGEHVITLVYEVLYGLQQKYDDDKSLQQSQIVSIVDYLNRITFSWNETLRAEAERLLARSLRLAEEYYDRIVSLADNLLERFISRANELDAEVESHKILYDNNAIAEDSFRAVLIENKLLLDKSFDSYTAMMNNLFAELNNASQLITTVDRLSYKTLMTAIATEYRKLLDAINYKSYVTRINDILDRINAVRTYDFPTGQTLPPPVTLQAPQPTYPPEEIAPQPIYYVPQSIADRV